MVTINGDSVLNTDGKLISDIEYKGLSTDTKPEDCGINSLFLELDTGNFYYFNGSSWVKIGG